jgi:hypothetical protein
LKIRFTANILNIFYDSTLRCHNNLLILLDTLYAILHNVSSEAIG